jgi:hypothetical protein
VSVRRRLELLEDRAMSRKQVPEAKPHQSDARRHMTALLDRIAALRRGELGPEEAARVEAMSAAVESRFASRRGEGGR